MSRPDDIALDLLAITPEQRAENVRLTVEAEAAGQSQCSCEGFQKLVEVNAIHLASGQMMSAQGELSEYAYYWLGPVRRPQEGMMAQFCPCCGKEVALTAEFLAKHTVQGGAE